MLLIGSRERRKRERRRRRRMESLFKLEGQN
jgi:hypothetical protein